jgi:hypothetical protein
MVLTAYLVKLSPFSQVTWWFTDGGGAVLQTPPREGPVKAEDGAVPGSPSRVLDGLLDADRAGARTGIH